LGEKDTFPPAQLLEGTRAQAAPKVYAYVPASQVAYCIDPDTVVLRLFKGRVVIVIFKFH